MKRWLMNWGICIPGVIFALGLLVLALRACNGGA